jgi:hypothetical protein
MNNFFIKYYSSISNKISFLNKIKYYAIQRFIIRFLANIFVPIWFVLTNLFFSKKLRKCESDKEIIVSLTTFPARINRIWIVIECILRQTYPPNRIILWLSKEQFDSYSSLPKRLLKLQMRGLEIEFCDEDLRSHKKYYYSLKKYPNTILITVDDDFIYHSNLINDLLKMHIKYPQAICCHRAVKIRLEDQIVLPYKLWEPIYNENHPDFNVFFTTGGGTLFPPNSLHKEVLNKKIFLNYCKYADDVWLNLMSQMNNTKIIKLISNYDVLIPLFIKGNSSLASINVDDGLNDEQFNMVRNYYIENKNIDPLINLLLR